LDKDTNYTRDSVKLIVEQVGDTLKITHADLEIRDVYQLTIQFIGVMADVTKQDYNSVVLDLKEI
jgi:hypothetical protein